MTTLCFMHIDRKEVDSEELALNLCNSQFMLQKTPQNFCGKQRDNVNILSSSQIFRSAGVA